MYLNNFLLSLFLILIVVILLYPKKTLKLFWGFLALFYFNPWLSALNDSIFSLLSEYVFIYIMTLSVAIVISIMEGIFLGLLKKEILLMVSSILVAVLFLHVAFDPSTLFQTILRVLLLMCLL